MVVIVIDNEKERGESPHPMDTVREQHTILSITNTEGERQNGEP